MIETVISAPFRDGGGGGCQGGGHGGGVGGGQGDGGGYPMTGNPSHPL